VSSSKQQKQAAEFVPRLSRHAAQLHQAWPLLLLLLLLLLRKLQRSSHDSGPALGTGQQASWPN
jgi:hypothetical protein